MTKVTQPASSRAHLAGEITPLRQLLARGRSLGKHAPWHPDSSLATFPRAGSGGPWHAVPSWLGMRQLCKPQKDPTANQKHRYPGNQPPWLEISKNSWELPRLRSRQRGGRWRASQPVGFILSFLFSPSQTSAGARAFPPSSWPLPQERVSWGSAQP